jgi:peptidoglycan hydrolase-like protein with peptidoglycan-binding domain
MPEAPLAVGAYGGNVAQFQNALLRLGFSLPESEIRRSFFGPTTRQAVQQLQLSHGLPVSGEVDGNTAAALTAGLAVADLQIPAPASASPTSVFSPAASVPPASQVGAVDGGDGQQAGDASATVTYAVSGIVAHPNSTGVGGLTVQIVDKNADPDVPLTQTATNDDGSYAVTFAVPSVLLAEHGKTQPALQARVLLGSTVLAASDVRYSAPQSLTLNVTIPPSVTTLPSEYETLTRMLALANQFAANSPSPASSSGTIQSEFYYALFRAGLPADADVLYRIDQKTVSAVWKQAIADGIIPASLGDKVAGALEAFQKLSAATILDVTPAPDTSSMRLPVQPTLGDDRARWRSMVR